MSLGVGTFPSRWSLQRVKRFARYVSTKATESTNPVALEHVESWTGRLIPSDSTYDAEGIAFRPGDVLFGKLRPYLAKVLVAAEAGEAVGDFIVMRPDATAVESRFLGYYLRTPEVIELLTAGAYGSKMPRTSWDELSQIPIAVPPVEEQRRIAAFLDHETARIDELVQEQETLRHHVKRRRMAAIDATLWGESPLPEWDLGSSSTSRTVQREGWRRLRLKHVVDQLTVGVVVEPTQYVAADGLPYIYGADIKDGAIHWEHARRIDPEVSRTLKKSLLRTGDVLVVRVGDPGQCAVVPPECEGGNCASVVHIRPSRDVLPEWLALAIRAARTQAQVDLVVYGAAQRQFNVAHALEFWLDVPPLAAQRRAVEAVRVADDGMRVLDEAVASSTLLLRERRSALITAAVTGQIDVSTWIPPDDWLSTEAA